MSDTIFTLIKTAMDIFIIVMLYKIYMNDSAMVREIHAIMKKIEEKEEV